MQSLNGYTKLASLVGAHPELAIFRRFGTLNAKNLLYLQAELVHLEKRLEQCVKADLSSNHVDRKIYDRDWQSLSESGFAPDGNGEQWATVLQMREKLKEYNEAMLLQTMLAKQNHPLDRDFQFLRSWMRRTSMGSVYLLGPDRDVWENPNFGDLIVLNSERQSLASRVIGDFLVHWWHRCSRSKVQPAIGNNYFNTIHYSDSRLGRVNAIVGIVCASTLPVLAIVILSFVDNMAQKLVIIAIFTSLFSAILGICSTSRSIEIFAATTAFAAVQVVFVGTTSGNIDYTKRSSSN